MWKPHAGSARSCAGPDGPMAQRAASARRVQAGAGMPAQLAVQALRRLAAACYGGGSKTQTSGAMERLRLFGSRREHSPAAFPCPAEQPAGLSIAAAPTAASPLQRQVPPTAAAPAPSESPAPTASVPASPARYFRCLRSYSGKSRRLNSAMPSPKEASPTASSTMAFTMMSA
ncbi:hypothetical protein [Paenibacillus stellifer]|uniref:hypothetical protein n=1 Tax=Paenibacillus stellifer TaxID=169760 RepID=UPI00147076C6|nr:hypothetical protein [Paenibacillus stellifer]